MFEQQVAPVTAAVSVAPAPDRSEVVAALRRRLAAVPARRSGTGASVGAAAGVGARAAEVARPVPVLAVPGPLAALLPRGGLVRGTVVAVGGATSLLLGLLAAVTGDGGWAAVVGRSGLGLLAAVEMGADLDRIALVPEPGPDAVDVAAVLLDGLDLVVLDLAGVAVTPTRARGLVARARHRGSVLVVTGGAWPGAELQLWGQVSGADGLGVGHGRLRSRELAVRVGGRGSAGRGRSGRVRLCPTGSAEVHWEETAEQEVVGRAVAAVGVGA